MTAMIMLGGRCVGEYGFADDRQVAPGKVRRVEEPPPGAVQTPLGEGPFREELRAAMLEEARREFGDAVSIVFQDEVG